MIMSVEDMESMMNRVLININPSKCIICKTIFKDYHPY